MERGRGKELGKGYEKDGRNVRNLIIMFSFIVSSICNIIQTICIEIVYGLEININFRINNKFIYLLTFLYI